VIDSGKQSTHCLMRKLEAELDRVLAARG